MTRTRTIWRQFWPFSLLCVLSASRWLVEGALPTTSSTLLSQAVGCAMAAGLVATAYAVRRRPGLPGFGAGRIRMGAQLGFGLVLVGPVVAQALSGGHLGNDPATLALALTPAVVAVVASSLGGGETGDLPGRLWPGLAGLTGLLLLLPEPSFSRWRPWFGLVSLPLLVGLGSCLAARGGSAAHKNEAERRELDVSGGLLLAAGVFGAFWLASSRRVGWSLSWGACGLDGVTALLSLTTLKRVGARSWSAQFLIIPLLGLVEALVFLRPLLDGRSWLGLGLLLLGGAYQLVRGPESAVLLTLRSRENVPGA